MAPLLKHNLLRRRPGMLPGQLTLLPIMGAMFVAFLVIGAALPVLPLYVHDDLGLSATIVGIIAGTQFGAAILSRVSAGRCTDIFGPKRAVVIGLAMAAASGLLYLASLIVAGTPALSATVLLLGRALLGVGESFIITGGQSWGLALLGANRTGKALAWVGSAMFGAFALGAPLGTALYGRYGFAGIALATTALPLSTLVLVAPLRHVAAVPRARAGLLKVMAAVALPGAGAALSSVGFGAISAFGSLLFMARGWPPWAAFSTFAAAFVVARLLLGQLPDRLGGAKVALASVLVEALGLGALAFSPGFAFAAAGAAFTGLGYALVYPGLGIEAIRRAPAESRGLAMGAYTVFLDVALGLGMPALGMLASMAGLGTAFLASAAAALGAAAISAALLRPTSSVSQPR